MSIVQGIKRILQFQTIVCIAISAVLGLTLGYTSAKSALLAGVVCIVPNVLFAKQLFHYRGARSAKKIVNNFYIGEALKIGMAILLFALVFMFATIKPMIFFLTFIAVQISSFFASLFIDNQQDRQQRD